ncbi:membrane steroid-binding protein 2 [Phtheirospermum japonicum]|uniref:Membrane steroid-binding protein 2 n=1 Tax=Phtheirospermum japonicum TaxID=374723 RepID=A0A830B2K5_9LAMI|nr:membrane steroid-binding protein 2 [Phtheirospermum japonicum]
MFFGPGGPYTLFSGKDASRALAKMSFKDKDLNGDLNGLGVFKLEALQDLEYKFMCKYMKVGMGLSETATPKETEENDSEKKDRNV